MTYHFTPLGGYQIKEHSQPKFDCEIWWRADDRRYANYDPYAEFEQPSGSHLVIELTPYQVVKHTPKGVRLMGRFGDRYFVLGTAIRQHAVPTKELALADLVARKQRHVAGCEGRLKLAKHHLACAEHALDRCSQ